MKKQFRKVIWRTLKSSLSRFLAIFAIVAIGVGFLAGLLAATPDMRFTGDKYFDESNLYDIRVISTLGLTDDDVKFFEDFDGIDEIMPAQSADIYLETQGKNTLVTRIHGVSFDKLANENSQNYINRIELIEGKLPEKPTECLIEKGTFGEQLVNIGDVLTVSAENESPEDVLKEQSFTVTGIVQSSYYFSFDREPATIGSGTTNLFIYADLSAFSREAYSEIYLTLSGAKELNSLDKDYENLRDSVKDNIEAASVQPIKRRHNEVITKADEELVKAKNEYADKKAEAEEKLADAEIELSDAKQKLADGVKEIADGERELEDGYKKLEDAKVELTKGYEKLDKARKEYQTTINAEEAKLEEGKKQYETAAQNLPALEAGIAQAQGGLEELNAGLMQLNASIASLEAALAQNPSDAGIAAQLQGARKAQSELVSQQEKAQAALKELLEGREKINQAKAQLEQGEAALKSAKEQAAIGFVEAENKLLDGEIEINKGTKELKDAEIELADGRKKLEDAQIEFADGQKEFDDAKKEADEKLADGQKQIDDAEKQIAELEEPEWIILDRDANMGVATFDSNISKVEAIAGVFPVFFFLVAALVALTTMTRMVEEERLQIGTVKALGYSKATIAFKYIIYALSASVLGCVVGLAVGFNLFPRVIWNAYGMMYNLPTLVCQFNVKFAVLSSGAAIFCTMLATANAVWSTLAEHPAGLMLPRAPVAGKRILLEKISFIWKRLKFTHKVTARNIFRYKKRFFMTIIGIAGCTGLLVAGFGMRDSVGDIIYKQFGEIFTYDFTATIKDQASLSDNDLLASLNNKSNISAWMNVSEEKSTNKYNDEVFTTYILVPESIEKMSDFYSLHERKSKKAIELKEEGVVITEKLSERSGIKAGEEITLKNADNIEGTFKVTGVVENYVENYVYMSREEYEKGFNAKPGFKSVIGQFADNDNAREAFAQEVLKNEEVNTISFVNDLKKSFDDMLKNITYIVYVLIISSAALAFVVLYNLTNINITEREKEIATIKVLGFYDKEVSAYVYRESFMLSAIGTAFGLVAGVFLHAFVIRTAEVDAVMFGREISPMSFVLSAALTLLFSALVNIVMNFKLKRISMVESMKAPE